MFGPDSFENTVAGVANLLPSLDIIHRLENLSSMLALRDVALEGVLEFVPRRAVIRPVPLDQNCSKVCSWE